MKYKAVIFDMDGVICHTNPDHSVAFDQFFKKRGLSPTQEEYAEHMYGKPNSYIFSHFLGRKIEGQELQDLENEKEGLFREIYKDKVISLPGFLEFLELLKANNIKIGVATSAPRANLNLIVPTLGIRDSFESYLANEDVATHKPSPEVYLKSAKNLGVDPADCLVFEDSFSGAMAGLNAGMQVAGVLSSHTPEQLPDCHYFIKDYTDTIMTEICQKLTI